MALRSLRATPPPDAAGRHSRRKGWRKMIRDLKAGRFCVVLFHRSESHTLRLVCALYQQGWSCQEIADYLNTRRFGLPDGPIVQFRTKGTVGRSVLIWAVEA